MTVDLGATYGITRWVVKNAQAGGESATLNTKDYKLQVSTDGVNFTDADSVTGNSAAITDRNISSTSARYARLRIITANQTGADGYTRVREFEIYAN